MTDLYFQKPTEDGPASTLGRIAKLKRHFGCHSIGFVKFVPSTTKGKN